MHSLSVSAVPSVSSTRVQNTPLYTDHSMRHCKIPPCRATTTTMGRQAGVVPCRLHVSGPAPIRSKPDIRGSQEAKTDPTINLQIHGNTRIQRYDLRPESMAERTRTVAPHTKGRDEHLAWHLNILLYFMCRRPPALAATGIASPRAMRVKGLALPIFSAAAPVVYISRPYQSGAAQPAETNQVFPQPSTRLQVR